MGYTEYVLSQESTYQSMFDLSTGIDEFLAKILYVDFAHYGFKNIYSDPDNPIDLNEFIDLGNFTIYDIVNGPEAIGGILPFTIMNTKKGNTIYQMIPWMLDIYYREIEVDADDVILSINEWGTLTNLDCPVYIGTEEPIPESLYCIWVDITEINAPTFKVYHQDLGWFSVGSFVDVLYKDIYDEDDRKQDIFWYFEQINGIIVQDDESKWVNADPLDLDKDPLSLYNLRARFLDHFKLGHLTESERRIFDSLISREELAHEVERCKREIFEYLENRIDELQIELIRQIHYDNLESFLDHIGKDNIHTTDFKTGWWNSKSDGDHGHYLDGKVFLSADDVVEGYVSIERMPDTAIDRLTRVLTHEERFALKRKQVQNGDSVFVYEETPVYEQGLYIVYDMYNLNNDSGWLFYRCRCIANIDFKDIWRLPTTLAGYRISDGTLVVKAEVVSAETGETTEEFVYPYRAKDMSMNYYLTTAIMNMDIYFTKMLDEIEEKLKNGDVLGDMWTQAADQVEVLNGIRAKWDLYRRVKGEYIRDAYNINAERFKRIEAQYEKIYGIAYNADDFIPLDDPAVLNPDTTDNETRLEEFLDRVAAREEGKTE